MQCRKCQYWGNGDGLGIPYDAGHMNRCNHPQISGMQHPSNGACGEPKTMVYCEGTELQSIMTRATFGCVLFKAF